MINSAKMAIKICKKRSPKHGRKLEMVYEPLKFVDTLGTQKHIVLFYEESVYAHMIAFRFIMNGLSRGEHGIYATEEDTEFIENEMANSGIDVKGFLRKKLLHIYQVPNPIDDPEGVLNGARKIKDRILADAKPPFRIVSRMVPESNTEEQIAAIIEIEHNDHITFNKLQGSLLCPHPVKRIETGKHGEWLVSLLQNHHTAIFAPRSGKGIAFNMR